MDTFKKTHLHSHPHHPNIEYVGLQDGSDHVTNFWVLLQLPPKAAPQSLHLLGHAQQEANCSFPALQHTGSHSSGPDIYQQGAAATENPAARSTLPPEESHRGLHLLSTIGLTSCPVGPGPDQSKRALTDH